MNLIIELTRFRFRLTLLVIGVLFTQHSHAQAALTWDNAGPTNNWSTTAGDGDWLPGSVVWTNGEDAIFGGTAEFIAVTTANTVDDITFGASWTITNGAGSLTLADSNSDFTVTNLANTVTIGETIAGAGSITKLGAGTLSLSNGNTGLTGNLIVSNGILKGTAANAFGASNNTRTITVNSGATLDIGVAGMFGGAGSTAVPTLDIAGGTVTNSGSQNNPLNNVTLNGGTLTATVDNGTTWRSWNINGIITSNGMSLISPGTAPNPGIRLKSTGGTSTMDVQSGTLTVSAPVFNGRSGTSPFNEILTGLTKTGAGTLLLSGVNGYTGTTTISAGTLLANTIVGGTNSATGTGSVSASAGATLGGSGQIRPTGTNAIAINGTLAPGASIGTFTIDSSGSTAASILTMANGSLFEYELGTAGASLAVPGSSDLLVINGASVGDFDFAPGGNTVDFLGTGAVGFYKLFDTSLADAGLLTDTWNNLTYDPTSGLVSSGLSATNLGPLQAGVFYVGTGGGLGNGGDLGDIYLQVTAIPEPSTFALLLCGATSLWLVARKRKA